MNFQQLRSVHEAVRQGFNLTSTAERLFASQSAISRQIRELEDELGVKIFQRHGKRLIDLTPPGREISQIIERLLKDRDSLKKVAENYQDHDSGSLVVIATHAQVRYRLPDIIKAFSDAYPQVRLNLHQAAPAQVIELLTSGHADVGFITEGLPRPSSLVVFQAYSWTHQLIVPAGHPLLQIPSPTLADIARYPIITFEQGMVGRERINQAFKDHRLEPNIIISAVDSDVIKTYVELGLGIGIIAEKSYNPEVDRKIVRLKSRIVFAPVTTSIAVRRGSYLSSYALAFIRNVVPELSPDTIRERVAAPAAEELFA